MKQLLGVLMLLASFVAVNSASGRVSANVFNPENKIHVYGKVVASQQITLDGAGDIILITSNSTEEVVPRVFNGTVSKASEVPLTDEIYREYRKLVPEGQATIGVLYERKVAPPATEPSTAAGLGKILGELAILSNTIGLRKF